MLSIGDVLAGFQLFDRFFKKDNKTSSKDISLVTRLLALLKAHGIHKNDLPALFPGIFSYHICSSHEAILKAITPQIIERIVTTFGINKDWLLGSSNQIYSVKSFDRNLSELEEHIQSLQIEAGDRQIYAYLLTPDKTGVYRDFDTVVIIAEPILKISNRNIYKYHFIGGWVFNYWRSRVYVAASCALLMKHDFSVINRLVPLSYIKDILSETKLMDYDFETQEGGLSFPSIGSFIVSDFIELPDELTKGVDQENGFGRKSALELWISLFEKGYMRCFQGYEEEHLAVRKLFQDELDKLTS